MEFIEIADNPASQAPYRLYPHNLTPQRRHLFHAVREGISQQTLRTESLQMAILHLREIQFDNDFREWGSAIAHTKRDQGWAWINGLQIWATHLYYRQLDRSNPSLSPLPADVFNTIFFFIESLSDYQIRKDFLQFYPSGVTRQELLQTLFHLYSPGKPQGRWQNRHSREGFCYLTSPHGNDPNDMRMIKSLIVYCEQMALNIPPDPMDGFCKKLEEAFRLLGISRRSFTDEENAYLKLHLLVAFHNVLLEVSPDEFLKVSGIEPPRDRQAMLSVNSLYGSLALYVGFFYVEDKFYVEPDSIGDGTNFERYYYPLYDTGLAEDVYLFEPDLNIRSTLYNHALEVTHQRGTVGIKVLDRNNCRYKPSMVGEDSSCLPS